MDWVRIAYRVVQRRGFVGADRDRAVWGVDDRSCTNACHGVIGIALVVPTDVVPTTLLLRLSRVHESGRRGRCRAISTFVWSSVYWRVRTGITVGALERDTRPRDFTFSTIPVTRPSLRPAIVDAAASSGTGRVERVAARTLPCVVAARALASATSIIACLRLSRNLCAVPRSGP